MGHRKAVIKELQRQLEQYLAGGINNALRNFSTVNIMALCTPLCIHIHTCMHMITDIKTHPCAYTYMPVHIFLYFVFNNLKVWEKKVILFIENSSERKISSRI